MELSPRREQGHGLGLQDQPRGQGCQGLAGLTTEDATHQQVDAACDGQAGRAQDGGEQEAGRYRQPGEGVEDGRQSEGGSAALGLGQRPQDLRTKPPGP